MKITAEYLNKIGARKECIDFFIENKLEGKDILEVITKGIEAKKLYDCNWLIVKIMTYKQYVAYSVFAAEQVISNYEKKYPEDNRPRLAIESAKKCIEDPSVENKKAAWSAGSVARSAAVSAAESTAWSAAESARSASWSAWSAESASWSAESAESAAVSTARSAAESAAWSARSAAGSAWSAAGSAAGSAAESALSIKILKYGLTLL